MFLPKSVICIYEYRNKRKLNVNTYCMKHENLGTSQPASVNESVYSLFAIDNTRPKIAFM